MMDMCIKRERETIWLKILIDKRDSLFEIPGFIPNWSYDEIERSLYRDQEIGKIETQHYNFRFYAEPFKIEEE